MDIEWSDCVVIKPLAKGGMASVFLAERINGNFRKRIAIKCILEKFSSDPEVRKLFTQEAERHAKLDHPHIVQLLDFGHDSRNLYMALEYASLGNLTGFSKRIEPDSREFFAQEIMEQIGSALCTVHKSLIHQDISPGNILYAGNRCFKLCDFGLAKQLFETNSHPHGKIRYMAPEQIASSQSDVRSDIFSLGVTVAEFYFGKRIYGDLSGDQLVQLIRSGDYLRHIVSMDLPASLSDVILRAVHPKPEHRFQSAQEMLDTIRAAKDAAPHGAGHPDRALKPPLVRGWSLLFKHTF